MKNSSIILLLAATLPLLGACNAGTSAEAVISVQKATPVTTTLPIEREIDYVLFALGSVESLNSPTIAAETAGRITRVQVEVGNRVATGQQLASIDASLHKIQSAEAEAEFLRQSVQMENQRKEVARLEQLARSQSVSQNQLEDEQDQLRVMQAQREVARKRWEHAQHMESMTQILAPHNGSIAHRHVALGDYVSPGQPLFDLVTVDRLRARLAFPEQDASSIAIGQEVQLRSPAAPDALALGEVTQINPRINAVNRAVEVLVEFDNPGGWYPGSSVDATLVVERKAAALTVPRLSVVTRDGKAVVFVSSNNAAVAREVTLGWQEPEWVEVTRGIAREDRIVVEGAAQLSNGSNLVETGTPE